MSAGVSTYDIQDTIAAIASGAQPASRGIVRLSGPAVLRIVRQVFRPSHDLSAAWDQPALAPASDETALWPMINLGSPGRYPGVVQVRLSEAHPVLISLPVDLWLWPTERTYTRQPSAEFHALGAPVVLQKILQACLRAGARPAGPGEFTMRAFLAGRMDLVQAEAVLGVIHAESFGQLQQGLQHLAGGLSTPLQQLRSDLIHLLAHLEAGLDFAEEDIQFISPEKLECDLQAMLAQVSAMLQQLRQRVDWKKIPRVLVVGPPNAGKSQLFNHLTQQPQALVSEISGTTRDYLAATIQLRSGECELVDTAGMEINLVSRQTTSTVDDWTKRIAPLPWASRIADKATEGKAAGGEAGAIEAARGVDQAAQLQSRTLLTSGDLLLFCWDITASTDLISEWLPWLEPTRTRLLWTKSDLLPATELNKMGQVSALPSAVSTQTISGISGQGVSDLLEWIHTRLRDNPVRRQDADGLLAARSMTDLQEVATALEQAIDVASVGGGEELVAAELRNAVDSLGKLVGTIYTDDLLDSIFTRFCIGK